MDTVTALTTRQRLLILTFVLGLTGLLVGAVACGPAAGTGTLEIVVAGLPTGTAADIAVGTQAVTASTSLTLAAGTYTLLAQPVIATASIMGDLLAPDQAQVDATVRAGQTTTVTITYSVAQQALLLAPKFFGDEKISVLTSDDLVDGGHASSAWKTSDYITGYTGMAYGPDGRLYVADYDNDTIVVVDGADLSSDGVITPAAVISIDGPDGPSGVAFDSNGNLWVGTYDEHVLMRFDGVLGLTGTVERAPALVLSADDSTFASEFDAIYDVFVDHLDNVWVADYGNEAVYRFDGIGALTGTKTVVPDLYLEAVDCALTENDRTMNNPVSLIVDLEGTLYVGNYDYEVSRFDDALALSAYQDVEASAYLYTGFAYHYMVALDQSGALWVGNLGGKLVRITDPDMYQGFNDVSDEFDLELRWLTETGSGGPGGGTLTFVPTQGRHAGY